MSSEAKREPGQRAYEAMCSYDRGGSYPWADISQWAKDAWAAVEQACAVTVSDAEERAYTRGLADGAERERAAVERLEESFRAQAVTLSRVIHERESARRDFEALNNAAADLVAEAVGPYDPPQRGSNLEKLYRLVQAPFGWKKAVESEAANVKA